MDRFKFSDLDARYRKDILDWVAPGEARDSVWELREISPKEVYTKFTQDYFWNQTDYPDDDKVKKLEKLIGKSGFTRPILIDEVHTDGPWLEGLHRTSAAYGLRLKAIPVLYRVS